MPKTKRAEVYEAIDSERDYQDDRWNADTTSSEGRHTASEYILYMEHYLQEARRLASTTAEDNRTVLDFVRKVTALGVACMEDNGAPFRLEPEPAGGLVGEPSQMAETPRHLAATRPERLKEGYALYMHHDRMVMVRSELRGLHRDYCLCFSGCKKFRPDLPRKENCPIADAIYVNCVEYGVVTPVWECPEVEW